MSNTKSPARTSRLASTDEDADARQVADAESEAEPLVKSLDDSSITKFETSSAPVMTLTLPVAVSAVNDRSRFGITRVSGTSVAVGRWGWWR